MSRREADPAAIESEIERTRSEMSSTLDAIQERLSPGQIMDEVMDHVRNGPGQFAGSLGRALRQNPIPAALIGVGIGWLMLSQGRGTSADEGALYGSASYGRSEEEEGRSYGAEEGGRLGEALDAVRERGAHLMDRARERLGGAGESVGIGRTLEEQPLLLGAIGLAVGAALGAVLPMTRQEDELMGPARDRLKHQAVAASRAQLERAQRAVEETLERAGNGSGQP